MKISEILWRAANEHLWDGYGDDLDAIIYSCDAVDKAATGRVVGSYRCGACAFLRELGCTSDAMYLFNEFKSGPKRQGARYAWLMFASMYAEELGL